MSLRRRSPRWGASRKLRRVPSTSSQSSFLRHFQSDLSSTRTKTKDNEPYYMVVTADFALISHLKDKVGSRNIKNYPGVLNISVYTNPSNVLLAVELIIKRIGLYISKQKNPKDFDVDLHQCKSSTLPCIIRVSKDKHLLADFLISTKPKAKAGIDYSLSKKLGYCVKSLDQVV